MKLKISILLTCLLALFIGSATAQTNVPPIISSNQTWTISGSPYLVNQNTLIDTGASVVVQPGVKIVGKKSLSINVRGEIQLKGTKSSPISVELLAITLDTDAVDYDPVSRKGCQFIHANFIGDVALTQQAINSRYTDFLAQSCTFKHCFYAINTLGSSSLDPVTVIIDSCEFIDSASRTYPIRTSGTGTKVIVTNTLINGGSGVTLYGEYYIENCEIRGVRNYCKFTGQGIVHCNKFVAMRDGLEIQASGTGSNPKIEFTNNTMDSCGDTKYSPMLAFRGSSTIAKTWDVRFHDNNFLHSANPEKVKVVIAGSNANPATHDTIKFTHNYWNTTDTAKIDSFIQDYKDNIHIFAVADNDSFRSSKVDTCIRSSCQASYYLAVDTSNKYNLFLINNSKGINKNTKYIWTFGDGNGSTKSNPTHKYKKFGLYEVCLTIYDSASNCYSTFCDSVGLDSNGKLLKQEGFTIFVLNEDDLISVPKTTKLVASVYPNPSAGVFTFKMGSEVTDDLHLSVFDLSGREVYSKEVKRAELEPEMNIDLRNQQAGAYILTAKTNNAIYHTRLLLVNP